MYLSYRNLLRKKKASACNTLEIEQSSRLLWSTALGAFVILYSLHLMQGGLLSILNLPHSYPGTYQKYAL